MRAAPLLALALCAGAALAQAPRITNEASGLACYDTQQLMEAHSALGFYNMARVQEFIESERCFVMRPEWPVRIDDERGFFEVLQSRHRQLDRRDNGGAAPSLFPLAPPPPWADPATHRAPGLTNEPAPGCS